MLPVDMSLLPATSAPALVARSSDAPPEFILADRPVPRFITARWRRRQVRLDEPMRMDHHLLSYCERGGATCTLLVDEVRLHGRQHTGSLTFLPAGRAVRWLLKTPTEVVHTHLYIADEVVCEALRASAPAEPSSLMALLNVRDPWFDGFFQLMAAECATCSSQLSLLGFGIDRVEVLMFRPPVGTAALQARLEFLDRVGERFLPMVAGVYVVLAVKRVSTLTPVKLPWQRRSAIRRRLVEPSTRGMRRG